MRKAISLAIVAVSMAAIVPSAFAHGGMIDPNGGNAANSGGSNLGASLAAMVGMNDEGTQLDPNG